MSELFTSHSALLEGWLPPSLIRALQSPDSSSEALAEGTELLSAAVARLTPFAPSLVVSRLDGAEAPYARIGGQYVAGTIVAAEVSGLAAISARLADSGRQGDEAAGAVVNRLLGELIGTIHAHGGGVLKAGGDSLTAFFDARRLGGDHPALASAAALAMQRRMAELRRAHETEPVPLRLRVAAHSGRVLAVEVGDQTHAELLVTGHAMSRVGRALLGTAPGEVIVTDKLLQLLDGADAPLKLAGQHLLRSLAEVPHPPLYIPRAPTAGPPTAARLATLADRVAALQPYAPRGIPGRLASATLGGGEFRPATVLLANFCAFNRLLDLLELPALIESDPTIVGHVLNTYYTRIQAVIQRYGGAVGRIDLAPYGDRFLALFGAPAAHEDDPARAVQTALAIRAELSETNQAITNLLREWAAAHPDQQRLVYLMSITQRQRVGIATGSVFAGIVGAPDRHEYTVIGQPVHVAARLLTAADDGETLLAEETYRAVSHLVTGEERPPVTSEGGTRAIPVFRAVQPHFDAAQSARQRAGGAPLVGRETELAQALETAQHALAPGGGRVLAIVGHPGVGKSRLSDETLRALRSRVPGASLVHEVCQSYDEGMPYAPLARLLQRLLYVPAGGDRATAARAVREQVEELLPGWARFVPLLGQLLDLPLDETDVTLALTSEQRRERLHELVAATCVALSRRQPLVLVVDDLQWADASSHAALLRVAEEIAGHPVLVLVVFRPAADLAEPWGQLPHAVTIQLGDLCHADSEALLTALLDGPLPEELRPVVERAHGTPFFLEEIVRYLRDSGVLVRDASGEWTCSRPVDPTAVPAQVEQLLVSRMDQLDATSRSVLDVAAVVGRRFSERLLAEAIREAQAEPAGAGGAGANGAAPRPIAALGVHELPGALAALVAADMLTPDAAAIEPTYTFRHALIRDVAYSSILFSRRHPLHASVAAALERVAAGELDSHRVALAQHYLHAGRSDLAFPHLMRAANSAQARYANSEALSLYRQALVIAPQHDQTTERMDPETASLYENLGDLLTLTGDYAAARGNYEWLLRVGVAGDAQARQVRKAALQRKVGGTHERQGSLDQARAWFERAAETIAAAPASPVADIEHGRILSDIGWFHFRHGELDPAEGRLSTALALVEPHRAHDELARLLNRLGGIAWNRGDIARAQHFVERSLAASKLNGSLVDQANALNNLSVLSESQGRYEDAVRHGLEAMALHEQVGNRRDLAIAAITVGYAYYNCERFDEAHAYFTQALGHATQVRDTYHQMLALLDLGRVDCALERWTDAENAIQRAQFIAAQLHLENVQVDSWVVMAEAALGRGDRDSAHSAYEHALVLAPDPDSEEHGRMQRLEARLALLAGDAAGAERLLTSAEALFERLQNVPEARRTRQLRELLVRPVPSGGLARAI